jgi:hypothetical protein
MIENTPSSGYPLEKIHAAHRQTTIIAAAIASSLIAYVAIVEFLRRSQPSAVASPEADMLRITFFALAGLVIFTATVTKGVLMRSAPQNPEARLSRLRTTTILSLALSEIPAVFGLALFLITRRRGDFYLLLVVAVYLIVRHFPQREAWETYVRRGSDAR